MAWITPKTPGRHPRRVCFRRGGKQHTVRIGKCDVSKAEAFRSLLDELIESIELGIPAEPRVRAWLERMPDGPRRSITSAGLAPKRHPRTLGELSSRYLETLEERVRAGRAKLSTLDNCRSTVDKALEYFDPSVALTSITPDEAEDFRNWAKLHGRIGDDRPLAVTYVDRMVRRLREMLDEARKRGWIETNPFRSQRGFRQTNPDRDLYVPKDLIERVIAATADVETRAILALARYCGVRGPSEFQPLRLEDLDVRAGMIRFRQPKTEHLDEHAERLCPLWPEVEPHVAALHDKAYAGQELALPDFAAVSPAACTARLKRAVRRAGETVWTKFMPNVRASCEHDLFRDYSIDEVCDWLGHSPETALRHYRRSRKVLAASMATDPSGLREARPPLRSPQHLNRRATEPDPPCLTAGGSATDRLLTAPGGPSRYRRQTG